jgi:hypothetical protein
MSRSSLGISALLTTDDSTLEAAIAGIDSFIDLNTNLFHKPADETHPEIIIFSGLLKKQLPGVIPREYFQESGLTDHKTLRSRLVILRFRLALSQEVIKYINNPSTTLSPPTLNSAHLLKTEFAASLPYREIGGGALTCISNLTESTHRAKRIEHLTPFLRNILSIQRTHETAAKNEPAGVLPAAELPQAPGVMAAAGGNSISPAATNAVPAAKPAMKSTPLMDNSHDEDIQEAILRSLGMGTPNPDYQQNETKEDQSFDDATSVVYEHNETIGLDTALSHLQLALKRRRNTKNAEKLGEFLAVIPAAVFGGEQKKSQYVPELVQQVLQPCPPR